MDNFNVAGYLLGTLIVLGFLDYARTALRRGLRELPGPILARFSGLYRLSLVYAGDAPQQYLGLHQKYGPIVRVGPNHVSISDVSMIPIIYGIGSKYLKTSFYSVFRPIYGGKTVDSMFTAQDPVYHKDLKTPVAALFSMTNMRNYEPYADECTDIFMRAMDGKQGQPVDLGEWLQWYAFDVIASITFQRRFGFMEEEKDIKRIIAGLDGGLSYVGIVSQYPGWHPWLMGNRLLVKTLAKLFPDLPDPAGTLMEITKEEIDLYDREGKQDERTDFLSQMRTKHEITGKLGSRDMINHLSNNLFAGSDTTAISLRAVIYYVIKNPWAQQKLVAEIDQADGDGRLSKYITYEESVKLPYLQAIIKEAMRIHPGVGYPLERYVPSGGLDIMGIHLPAGTEVSMTAPVIHQNKEIFGMDADRFRPERWIDSTPEQIKIMDRCNMTFGYGSRTCIGKNISIMEMGKLVSSIFRHYDLEWASPKQEWKLDAKWFWKQTGVIVKLTRRKKA